MAGHKRGKRGEMFILPPQFRAEQKAKDTHAFMCILPRWKSFEQTA